MMVRLPRSRADCMLWVTIRQVSLFSSTICRVSASTFSAEAGSSAAVCSSRSRSFGGLMVAIIRVSAWRCPPESRPKGCCIRSSRPMPSRLRRSRNSSRSARVSVPSQPPCPAARARFSSMLMPGALPRSGSWNRRPMFFARLYSGTSVMSAPSSRILPLSVKKLPETALKSVDLPAPFAPMMVTKSPSCTRRDRSSRAFLAFTVPGLKVLEIWETFSIPLPPSPAAGPFGAAAAAAGS